MSVSVDMIQITILILSRGPLSSKYGREDEDGPRANIWDYQVETEGLQSGSTGNYCRGHCCKSQLDDREDEHPDHYIINIRVYLRREFRALRSDSHTICDPKQSI